MAVATYTKTGTKAATAAKLDKAVFGVETKNHELLKAAYTAYLANGRENLAVVKTRGLVRGGGKKPWKQKGTGRARFGSSRVPIWRGGGITFGPTGQENYSKQLNTKAKRLAIRQALSLASAANKITVIEDIASKEGKTSELVKLLGKIDAQRNVLVVVDKKTPELVRAARNIQDVQIVSAQYVNVYDVLNADCIVFSQGALKATTDWLSKETK
ncbi:MAG TPA: 50S ribosomal protein L4 [Verrucomicrobiae bacterium]|jgi:large subunit ribosomal protein L4|nr:50S ribosomal protein L4 [Verrucomicrobiae bacterium]